MKEYLVTISTTFAIDAENEDDARDKYDEGIRIENGAPGEMPIWTVVDSEMFVNEA